MKILGSIKCASDGLAVIVFASGLALVAANLLAGCAGWGKATCSVIDLAHAACPTVVQFVGQDGGLQQMTLTQEDAVGLSRMAAARSADAGAGK